MRALPEPISGYFGPTGQNFFQSRAAPQDQRKDTISVDYYPTEKHQLRFRFQLYHGVFPDAFRGGTDRAPATLDRPNQTATINWVWTLSPTWIAETVIAGSRDQVFITVQTEGDRFRRSKYGINYPYIFQEKEIFDKIPTVDWADFNGLDGGPYPAQSTGPIYQINQNWTNIRGNHTIKFGGYFERAGQNDFDQINVAGVPGGTNNQNGRFVFSNGDIGWHGRGDCQRGHRAVRHLRGVGNALLHALSRPHVRVVRPGFLEGHAERLRLEAGVRHSIIQPYYSLWGNMLVFDPKYYDPSIAVRQDPRTGVITGGDFRSRFNGMVIPGDGCPARRLRDECRSRRRASSTSSSVASRRPTQTSTSEDLPATAGLRLRVQRQKRRARWRRPLPDAAGRQRLGLPWRQPAAAAINLDQLG